MLLGFSFSRPGSGMPQSGSRELRQERARVTALRAKVERLERELQEAHSGLRKKGKAPAKARGQLDRTSRRHAMGAGAAAVPVAMWTGDFVDAFYAAVDDRLVPAPEFWELAAIHSCVEALTGFVMAVVVAGVYKMMMKYQPQEGP